MGSSIYDAKSSDFVFNTGPLFANVVLADEINRTPPRTQSAMLEAMSDGQVSVDGKTHRLPRPFIVIATQNPFEFEGTYPLPESQLDRFLVRLSMGYPDRDDERQVLVSHRESEPVDSLEPVIHIDQILELQRAVRHITVDESLYEYLLDIVTATRTCSELHVGVSTRGAIVCIARPVLATIHGRSFVVPDDVKQLAVPVLSHRVVPKGYRHGGQRTAVEKLIQQLVDDVPVPG